MLHTVHLEESHDTAQSSAVHWRPMRLIGRVLSVCALLAWVVWLGWRLATMSTAVGAFVFVAELIAVAAAIAMTVGLWHGSANSSGRRRGAAPRMRRWLDEPGDERVSARHACAEVAAAVRRHPDEPCASITGHDLVRVVVATDGLRRALFVGAVVVVLLSGRVPFELPPVWAASTLGAAVVLFALGHACLSGWAIRPGDRFVWSLATIGAGLGRRASTGVMPVRWTAVMATVVVLNLAVALRGVSDRWTHGLETMPRDVRVAAMAVALTVAAAAFTSLRTLPRPNLGEFGATGRLDEVSTRRWALGATAAVALLGLVLGALPSSVVG